MKKLQDVAKTLLDMKEERVTTQALAEININIYYTNLLVENGYLNKVKRGTYTINRERINADEIESYGMSKKQQAKKEKEDMETFLMLSRTFKDKVLKGLYSSAYSTLVDIYNFNKDENYNQFIYLYFKLLRGILGPNYDYSFIDVEKIPFPEEKNNDLDTFKKYVLNGDYILAKPYILNYEKNELAIRGYNTDSTLILANLTKALVNNLENSQNYAEATKVYRDNIEKLVSYIKSEHYGSAYDLIDECIKYTSDKKNILLLERLKKIIISYLNLRDCKVKVQVRPYVQTNINSIKSIVESLDNNDYAFAYNFIKNGDVVQNKNILYKIIRVMLRKYLLLESQTKTVEPVKAVKTVSPSIPVKQQEPAKKTIPVVVPKIANDTENKYVSKSRTNTSLSDKLEQIRSLIVDSEEKEEVKVEETKKEAKEEEVKPIVQEEVQVKEESLTPVEPKAKEEKVVPKAPTPSIFKEKEDNLPYSIFIQYIENDDLEAFRTYLNYYLNRSDSIKEAQVVNDILNYYNEMVNKKKTGFPVLQNDYTDLSDLEKFNKALINKDYKVAFSVIGKISYRSTDMRLLFYKAILHKMYDLVKIKDNAIKVVNPEPKKEEKPYVHLTIDDLYPMVYDRKYDEVFAILDEAIAKNIKLDSIEYNTWRLILILHKYQKQEPIENGVVTFSDPDDYLKSFYYAINVEDIMNIRKYLDLALGRIRNTQILEYYQLIVNDIEDLIAYQEEMQGKKEQAKEADQRIKDLLDKKEDLTEEEINKLEELLTEKSIIPTETTDYMFSILDVLKLSYSHLMDENYFAELVDTDFANIDEEIKYALANGYYLTAQRLLEKVSITMNLKDYTIDDKIIFTRMLKILKNRICKPFVIQDKLVKPKEELVELKRYMKKTDYYGAFKYLLTLDLEKLNLKDIIGDLFILFYDNIKVEENLGLAFKEAMEKEDYNSARIAILDYQELLNRTSMKNEETYKNNLESMTREYKKRR